MDRRRAIVVALVLLSALFLASVPFLYGYAVEPEGTRFWAVPVVNSFDANQYLAFTRIVADGSLLVGDPFTSEPHQPRLLLPQVWFQALVMRLTGSTPQEAFQVSRVLSGAALLLAGCWLGFLLLPRWRLRWLFLALLCFSTGASWYLELLGYRIPNGDLVQPEGNTFFSLANLPHVALASALLTALFALLLEYERSGEARWLWITVGVSLLLSWTHPFDYVPLGMGVLAYGALRWWWSREIPVRVIVQGGAAVLGALPAALYLGWLVSTDPIYKQLANDVLQVNPFRFYLIAHVLLVVPALAVLLQPEARRRYALPLCWVVCAFLFLFTPFRLGGKQPRVVGGIHVPLAILAAAGADLTARWLAQRVAPGKSRRVVLALDGIYAVGACAGVIGMVQRQVAEYARREPDFFQTPGIQQAFSTLDRLGDRSQVTLGGEYTAGWAPTWADTRVYHGHWHMTLREPEKRAERNWFFTAPAPPEQRAKWLRQRGIDWVVWWPPEWQGWAVPLDHVPGLQPVYRGPDVVLYHFEPSA
ncbi:MAG: hypothetical protein ACK47B_05950 [Armatimonadota bacterium]